MNITGKLATDVFNWLNTQKIKYDINVTKSDPLHGRYCLTFDDKKEEMIAKLRWGIV